MCGWLGISDDENGLYAFLVYHQSIPLLLAELCDNFFLKVIMRKYHVYKSQKDSQDEKNYQTNEEN